MTPNEVATDISRLSSVGGGSINASTSFTYTFQKMDDANTWD